MVWAFLSTTVQLPATQRKVEGEERDIQLVHVNEASSCIAQGYCVPCSPRRESGTYQTSPPHFPPPTHPRTPHCWIWSVFSDLGQKRGRPPFRGLKVLQLNLDSFCDYIRILSAVIGHWEAEIDFWFFPRKWWKYRRARIFGQSADILTSRAGTVRERRRPYKLGGLSVQATWGPYEREATSSEQELFSQTWRKSAVGDSAEPK